MTERGRQLEVLDLAKAGAVAGLVGFVVGVGIGVGLEIGVGRFGLGQAKVPELGQRPGQVRLGESGQRLSGARAARGKSVQDAWLGGVQFSRRSKLGKE